jgi:uncharacterized protein DUF6542
VSQQVWERERGQVRLPMGAGGAGVPRVRASLTGRGAVLLMIAAFLAGLVAASWLGWPTVAGLGFVFGSAAAARYTRPADLVTVVVTGPLLFFCALLPVKLLTAGGNVLVSAFAGSLLTLASVAGWLFLGVLLTVIIAWRRGMSRAIGQPPQIPRPRPHTARETDGAGAPGPR